MVSCKGRNWIPEGRGRRAEGGEREENNKKNEYSIFNKRTNLSG